MSISKGIGDSRKNESRNDFKGAAIITAIFRSIEQADSLIELLVQRHEGDENRQYETDGVKSSYEFCESRKAKDDAIIIQEIKDVNCQLRNLVTELMSQLESKDRTVLMLKERLAQLEEEYARLKQDINTEISSPSTSSPDIYSKEDDQA